MNPNNSRLAIGPNVFRWERMIISPGNPNIACGTHRSNNKLNVATEKSRADSYKVSISGQSVKLSTSQMGPTSLAYDLVRLTTVRSFLRSQRPPSRKRTERVEFRERFCLMSPFNSF